MKQGGWIIWLCLQLSMTFGQSGGWSLELGSGAGVGWWVYDKGYSDTLNHWHQGYDRSYLSLSVPAELAVTYEHKRWQLGLGLGFRLWDVGRMVGSDNRRGDLNTYRVAEVGKDVYVYSILGQVRYTCLERKRFRLALAGKLGTFQVQHQHPAASRMSAYFSQEIGVHFRFQGKNRWACWFQPQVGDQWIVSQGRYRGEAHHFYHVGFMIGSAWQLSSPK